MMRKYLNFIIIGIVLVATGVTGCYEQEVVAPIAPGGLGYATATFTTDFTGSELNEGDTIYYTVTLDKQLDVAVTFSAKVIGGTATDDDFTVSGGIVEPYTNEAKIMIIVNRDNAADVDETVQLEIGAHSVGTKYMMYNTTNSVLNVTLKNFVSDDLVMEFAWDKDIFVNAGYEDYPDYGWDISTYDHVDFDIFVSDAEGYDNNNPWGTFNPVTYAATGDTPEEMTFSGLADGGYVIFSELWYNGFIEDLGYGETATHKPMPITATFLRQGVFEVTVVQDPSQTMSTDQPGAANADYEGEVVDYFVAGVTIGGGEYVITDYAGTEIGRGKISDNSKIRLQRPAYLRK